MSNEPCPVCNDEGQWTVSSCDVRELVVGDCIVRSSSVSGELCSCRKALSPRDGVARWWTVGDPVVVASADLALVDWSVSYVVEVPVSADNYIVTREGENVYWPALITLSIGGESVTMIADEVRELAAGLVKAADAVDAIDGPAFASRAENRP